MSEIFIGTLLFCLERYIGLGLRDRGSEGGEIGLGFWNLVLLTAFKRQTQ